MKTGFIGLGSMGGGQAGLLAQTSDLTVYDNYAPALAAFEGKAKLAKAAADVGRDAEFVGICVRDDAQVNESVDAVLPVMPKGSVLLIHSTVRPATVKAAAERAAAHGITIIDAPVTSTERDRNKPYVFTMTGGDEQAALRAKLVIESYSTNTLHVGPLGSAMALKISNNLCTWVEILVAREAVEMAEAAGVPTDRLFTVMKRNGAMTPSMYNLLQDRGRAARDPDYRELMVSQSGIGEKDMELAAMLGDDVGKPCPTALHTRKLIRSVMTDYFGAL